MLFSGPGKDLKAIIFIWFLSGVLLFDTAGFRLPGSSGTRFCSFPVCAVFIELPHQNNAYRNGF